MRKAVLREKSRAAQEAGCFRLQAAEVIIQSSFSTINLVRVTLAGRGLLPKLRLSADIEEPDALACMSDGAEQLILLDSQASRGKGGYVLAGSGPGGKLSYSQQELPQRIIAQPSNGHARNCVSKESV